MTPPAHRRSEQGFTLLEMMVALAVLSIAALALVRLDAFTLHAAGDLSSGNIARIVADNAAVDVLTDPAAPTIGTSAAAVPNAGGTWQVSQIVAPTADPSLLRVDIRVTGPGGGRAALTIIRPAG